jgi:hypothetical protein
MIAEAVKEQHISIFGNCEEGWHFSQQSYNVTINSHNNQLMLHTNSHASDLQTVAQYGRREGRYWAQNPNYCKVK